MGRPRSGLREAGECLALAGVLAILGRLPAGASLALGSGIGQLSYALLGRRRRIALDQLERAWGTSLPEAERRRIALESFAGLGRLLADFARLPRIDRQWVERHLEFDGWDAYLDARARGRGVLLLAAHFGSWELVPHALAVRGYPMAFVVRPADNPRVEALVRRYREVSGNAVIAKREALRECLRRLRRGESVGLLIDQHVPADKGLPTRLFGHTVYTTAAAAALALRTGAAVLPAFAIRQPQGRHRIVLGPEIELGRTDDAHAEQQRATAAFVAVVEDYVRAHPDHWLWAHRRFRDPPGAVGPRPIPAGRGAPPVPGAD